MTVRCGWCGKRLQRKAKPKRMPLCRGHEKYRQELAYAISVMRLEREARS